MSATKFSDAKKECSNNPKCHMFFDDVGTGTKFYACENTSSIRGTLEGSILYQDHGNEMTRHYKVSELYHNSSFSI